MALVFLALVGFVSLPLAAGDTGSAGFYYVIVPGPRFPWWPEMKLPPTCNFQSRDPLLDEFEIGDCRDSNDQVATWHEGGFCIWSWNAAEEGPQHCAARVENRNVVTAIRALAGLRWPDQADETVAAPRTVVVNGPPTAGLLAWQRAGFERFYGSVDPDGAGFGPGAKKPLEKGPGDRLYAWTDGNYRFLQLGTMLNETGERTGPEAAARRWLGGQLQAAVVKGEYTVVVADNDRLDRDYLEAFTHSNIVAFFTASPAALGFTGFISRADVDRCPPGSVKAVFNRIGGRIPVFGAGHPGRYPLDHKFLLIEFLPASMRVAAIDATGGEPAFLSSSGSTFQYTAEFAPIP